MLEYDRIDISEGIDIDKTHTSKKCKICRYWYFKDEPLSMSFKYEPYLCNDSHGLMLKAISFNDVAIAYFKGTVYRIHFW